MTTFDDACAATQAAAGNVLKAIAKLSVAAKQFEKAAAIGDVNQLKKSTEGLRTALDAAREEVANASGTWPFEPQEEEDYLRAGYEKELCDALIASGLTVRTLENRILAFPRIIRVVPQERGLRIDGKRMSALRPSFLAGLLKRQLQRKPRMTNERFADLLYRGYAMLVGRDEFGQMLPLSRIYEALTLLPGVSADYDESEFVRDVYQLDSSGFRRGKNGAELLLMEASSASRGGRGYSFLTPAGETRSYYGVAFREDQHGGDDRRR